MANITPNCFPSYSTHIVPKPSLKQRLQICAQNIHYHVFYLFITTTLLKQSPHTANPVNLRIILTVILALVVSSVLFLFLYPLKLALLGVSLCLKDAKTTTISPIKIFARNLQDICNETLYINSDTLHITPESSPFLKSFLIPGERSWKLRHLENEISKIYSGIPDPLFKILHYVNTKFLQQDDSSSSQQDSLEASLYYSVLQKLTVALQDPSITKPRKQQLLNYIGSYAFACPPTWIEVIFRELTEIYNKQDTSVNYILLCVQMFKENLLQLMTNRSSPEWHHMASFKHYHGRSLGLNMDSLARIQFTGYLILKKQGLYDRVYKRFISSYRDSVSDLIEYIRYQISESSQDLKNSLSLYLCETMRTLRVPENEISSILSSLFYDDQFDLNTSGVAFILLMLGILTTNPETTTQKIKKRLCSTFC
ncbi:DUF1548 domain-containing protein [Chlamydia psittaci]|uniref:DUF1548 domain-containing protein n=1 Tax=Chlamydia psittaci TaxID=83554 RepID=UPI00027E1563|nr:DUF1548 domain-containing protein [Chlamydia psittaci]AFS25366.1 hypothetical protein B602_0863 [Chlamydia psittaci M56]